MRTGLGVSVAVHAAFLAYGIFGLPLTAPYEVALVETLPVELVETADVTDLKQGSKDADVAPAEKPQPKPEVAAPTPVPKPAEKPAEEVVEATPPPPAPEPEPEPVEPEPEPPEPEQVAALPPPEPEPPEPPPPEPAEEAEAEPVPEKPAPKPRSRPKPPKQVAEKPAKKPPPTTEDSKFDSDKIAALLDKQEPAGGGDPTPSDQPQTVGIDDGKPDAAMTQSWIAALSSRLAGCWDVPTGVREAQSLSVTVGFTLLPDGSVTGYPTIMQVVGVSNPLAQVAAEAAQRAVVSCGPYGDIFPVEHYETWQSIEVKFNPRDMFSAG